MPTHPIPQLDLDVVVIGGGCAGLWLLDELSRRGHRSLLLEAGELGGVQTVASQGILHGGVKYVLSGLRSASAAAIRDMPARWQASLSGVADPDLSQVRLRSQSCYLWRSDSWQSWAGLLGARALLEVKPVPIPAQERPAVLAQCPGQVFQLDEQVIDTVSFAQTLAQRHPRALWKITSPQGCQFQLSSDGQVETLTITHPNSGNPFLLRPRWLVLAAGVGNEDLRTQLGLSATAAQRRPLQMVLVRGKLPILNGHCVDGAKTRVTVTAATDSAGRTVWQVGGQLAEDGVALSRADLIAQARRELSAVLPGWSSEGHEWATYRIDRAERSHHEGKRPDDVQMLVERNILTIWPTKLVLAPRMAEVVCNELGTPAESQAGQFRAQLTELAWPAPELARPLWERPVEWTRVN